MPTITTATADRVPVLTSVLARTFVDDPMVAWPFYDHDVEERAVPLFAALLRGYAALDIVVRPTAGPASRRGSRPRVRWDWSRSTW